MRVRTLAGMWRVHVNQHVLAANAKHGRFAPALSAKGHGQNLYGHTVTIPGPAVMVYRPEKPLSCGARAWVHSDEPVMVSDDLVALPAGWCTVHVSRLAIRHNLRAAGTERVPVLTVARPDGTVTACDEVSFPRGAVVAHRASGGPGGSVVWVSAPVVTVS